MRTEHITTIGNLVRSQSAKYGDKTLWIMGSDRYSYREYDGRTDRIAWALAGLGVGKGDRVATYIANSVELLDAYTGIAKAGAVTVFTNEQLTPREIEYIFQDSAAKVIITDAAHLQNVEAVLPQCPATKHVVVLGGDPRGPNKTFADLLTGTPVPLPEVATDDVAWIGYTSGTTGRPKGALLTHRGVTWACASMMAALGYQDTDRFICVLPMFHSYAVNCCYLQIIAAGGTQVILDRFSPAKTLEAIQQHKITIAFFVPTMCNYLVNFKERTQYDTGSLRLTVSAGAVMPTKLMHEFEAAFGVPIHDGWGSTETSSFATLTRAGMTRVPGSCGVPFPGCAVRIVDDQDRDVPYGERGEMVIRSPHVTPGYINKPEQTAQTLRNGWYHSGDLAYMDANGYLFVVDRIKDVIICGGYNIAPKEVEDVVLAHPSVMDVAAVGVPDEARGEVVKVCVVLKEGKHATADELTAFCKERLAAYKLPRLVEFRPALPKTASGKIQRFMLREKK